MFQIVSAVKMAYQNICFSLKHSESSFIEVCRHLSHLTDELRVLSLFDNDLDQETEAGMVTKFNKENMSATGKPYMPSKEALCGLL